MVTGVTKFPHHWADKELRKAKNQNIESTGKAAARAKATAEGKPFQEVRSSWMGRKTKFFAKAADGLGTLFMYPAQWYKERHSEQPTTASDVINRKLEIYESKKEDKSRSEQKKRTRSIFFLVLGAGGPILNTMGWICKTFGSSNREVRAHQKELRDLKEDIREAKRLVELRNYVIALHHLVDTEETNPDKQLFANANDPKALQDELLLNFHELLTKTYLKDKKVPKARPGEPFEGKLDAGLKSRDFREAWETAVRSLLAANEPICVYKDDKTGRKIPEINSVFKKQADFIKKNAQNLLADIEGKINDAHTNILLTTVGYDFNRDTEVLDDEIKRNLESNKAPIPEPKKTKVVNKGASSSEGTPADATDGADESTESSEPEGSEAEDSKKEQPLVRKNKGAKPTPGANTGQSAPPAQGSPATGAQAQPIAQAQDKGKDKVELKKKNRKVRAESPTDGAAKAKQTGAKPVATGTQAQPAGQTSAKTDRKHKAAAGVDRSTRSTKPRALPTEEEVKEKARLKVIYEETQKEERAKRRNAKKEEDQRILEKAREIENRNKKT